MGFLFKCINFSPSISIFNLQFSKRAKIYVTISDDLPWISNRISVSHRNLPCDSNLPQVRVQISKLYHFVTKLFSY